MIRICPDETLINEPCSVVAVAVANGGNKIPVQVSKADGYMTLEDMNRYVRSNLHVAKRVYYKRGQRPKLCELECNGRAIICVLGHYIYVEDEKYYSFFDNLNDDVISIWFLKD